MLRAHHFSKRLAGSTQTNNIQFKVHKVNIQFKVHKVNIQFKVHKVNIQFKVHKVNIQFKVHRVKIQFKVHKVKIQFKVHKVKIQFPDVQHCYSAGLGSLVPIKQRYTQLFTLTGARDKSSPISLKYDSRATYEICLLIC